MERPLLSGTIYSKQYKNWNVSWESDGDYRHWCIQRPINSPAIDLILVVLTNPGSLSKDGRKLPRERTLGVLRRVFEGTQYGCLVLNLFDFATPKPSVLFEQWNSRDKKNSQSVYKVFPQENFVATIFAYGDYENNSPPAIGQHIKDRIGLIREILSDVPVIESPRNRSGSPKHVMNWQRCGHVDEMSARIREFRMLKSIKQIPANGL